MTRALKQALPNLSAGLNPFVPKCASPHCRPRPRFLSFTFRSEGTRIGNNWYCSAECFEEAARNQVGKLVASRAYRTESRKPRMPLGLTALSLEHISAEQLQQALEFQREHGGRIGEIFCTLGFMKESQITSSLSAQWGHPILSLQNREVEVEHTFPIRLMELHSMLPIHYIAQTNKLVVGFAELVEHRILSTIENLLGCIVVPCFITRGDFESHFRALRLQQTATEEVVFEQPASIHEIARITRSYAWQISALSVEFGLCSDYIWSRLKGSKVSIDLLSKI